MSEELSTGPGSCWFSGKDPDDKNPMVIPVHRSTGIAGGTGPTGSVRSVGRNVLIPRSRYARRWHAQGLLIRLLALGAAATLLILCGKQEAWMKGILLALLVLIAGSLLMHLLYRLAGVKPAIRARYRHPDILALREQGYQAGFHPVVSSTPFGWIWVLFRKFLI